MLPSLLIKLLNIGTIGAIALFCFIRWFLPAMRSALNKTLIKRATYAENLVTLEQERKSALKSITQQTIEYEELKNRLSVWQKGLEIKQQDLQQTMAALEKDLREQEERKKLLRNQYLLHQKALSQAINQIVAKVNADFQDESNGQLYINKIINSQKDRHGDLHDR